MVVWIGILTQFYFGISMIKCNRTGVYGFEMLGWHEPDTVSRYTIYCLREKIKTVLKQI